MIRLVPLLIVLTIVQGCSFRNPRVSVCHGEPFQHFEIPDTPIQVAVVLGGGGARGMAHVGVLEEFERANIPIDLLVGCSAGSVVGALYADLPDASRVKNILMNRKRKDFIETNLWKIKYGIFHRKPFIDFMNENVRAQKFQDLQIPLIVVATDLMSADSVPFNFIIDSFREFSESHPIYKGIDFYPLSEKIEPFFENPNKNTFTAIEQELAKILHKFSPCVDQMTVSDDLIEILQSQGIDNYSKDRGSLVEQANQLSAKSRDVAKKDKMNESTLILLFNLLSDIYRNCGYLMPKNNEDIKRNLLLANRLLKFFQTLSQDEFDAYPPKLSYKGLNNAQQSCITTLEKEMKKFCEKAEKTLKKYFPSKHLMEIAEGTLSFINQNDFFKKNQLILKSSLISFEDTIKHMDTTFVKKAKKDFFVRHLKGTLANLDIQDLKENRKEFVHAIKEAYEREVSRILPLISFLRTIQAYKLTLDVSLQIDDLDYLIPPHLLDFFNLDEVVVEGLIDAEIDRKNSSFEEQGKLDEASVEEILSNVVYASHEHTLI